MKLEIQGDLLINVINDAVLNLPEYMTALPKDQIRSIQKLKNCNKFIIACGRHKNDIVIITGNFKIMTIDIDQYDLPRENCIPINYGNTILFPQVLTVNNSSLKLQANYMLSIASTINIVLDKKSYLSK